MLGRKSIFPKFSERYCTILPSSWLSVDLWGFVAPIEWLVFWRRPVSASTLGIVAMFYFDITSDFTQPTLKLTRKRSLIVGLMRYFSWCKSLLLGNPKSFRELGLLVSGWVFPRFPFMRTEVTDAIGESKGIPTWPLGFTRGGRAWIPGGPWPQVGW